MVFDVFARRLYKDHFIFINDLAVATGRKACRPPGPSQVADVMNAFCDWQEEDGDEERNGGDAPVSEESPHLSAPGAPAEELGAGGNFYMNDEEEPHLEDSGSEMSECVGMLYEDSESEQDEPEAPPRPIEPLCSSSCDICPTIPRRPGVCARRGRHMIHACRD